MSFIPNFPDAPILILLSYLWTMGIVSPEKCDRLAQKINAWVQGVLDKGGGDEQLLEGIYDYMAPFKTIMDNLSRRELDALINKYDGFYRFTKLLEDLAQAIADGRINPDEFEGKPKKQKPKKGFGWEWHKVR